MPKVGEGLYCHGFENSHDVKLAERDYRWIEREIENPKAFDFGARKFDAKLPVNLMNRATLAKQRRARMGSPIQDWRQESVLRLARRFLSKLT